MSLERIALNGEKQTVTFLPSLGEGDVHIKIKSEQNIDSLLQSDYDLYACRRNARDEPALYIPHWREAILAFKGTNPEVDPANMELGVVSSFQVQALRKGVVNDITPVTIIGLVKTADNQFVYGIRGGSTGTGLANTIPGGHVIPSSRYSPNPIFSSFYGELNEESGIAPQDVTLRSLIGYQIDPVHKSMCFVMQAATSRSSAEIAEMHTRAFHIYDSARKAGVPELEARAKIEESGLPNVDAWENRELIFLPTDREYIANVIKSGKIAHRGAEYNTLDNSIGALMLHNQLSAD